MIASTYVTTHVMSQEFSTEECEVGMNSRVGNGGLLLQRNSRARRAGRKAVSMLSVEQRGAGWQREYRCHRTW